MIGGDSTSLLGGRGNGWISQVLIVETFRNLPFFGMSGVLTVPGNQPPQPVTVPEPSSLLGLITLGGLMLGGAVRLTGGGSDT